MRGTARRVTSIGPVQNAILKIELKIDRLRKAIKDDFDVSAIGGRLPLGDFDAGAKDTAQFCIVWPLLRPIDVPALGIDGNSNAPSGLVAAVDLTLARLHQNLGLRAIKTGSHDAHAFAI